MTDWAEVRSRSPAQNSEMSMARGPRIVNGPELLDKFLGESVANIAKWLNAIDFPSSLSDTHEEEQAQKGQERLGHSHFRRD